MQSECVSRRVGEVLPCSVSVLAGGWVRCHPSSVVVLQGGWVSSNHACDVC